MEKLTPAELRIVPLVAEGLQTKDIAKRLSLSHKTISSHLRTIYQKLYINNRTQLTQMYIKGEIK